MYTLKCFIVSWFITFGGLVFLYLFHILFRWYILYILESSGNPTALNYLQFKNTVYNIVTEVLEVKNALHKTRKP
jgi:hypothetical protein